MGYIMNIISTLLGVFVGALVTSTTSQYAGKHKTFTQTKNSLTQILNDLHNFSVDAEMIKKNWRTKRIPDIRTALMTLKIRENLPLHSLSPTLIAPETISEILTFYTTSTIDIETYIESCKRFSIDPYNEAKAEEMRNILVSPEAKRINDTFWSDFDEVLKGPRITWASTIDEISSEIGRHKSKCDNLIFKLDNINIALQEPTFFSTFFSTMNIKKLIIPSSHQKYTDSDIS